MFADDTYLFLKVSEPEIIILHDLFQQYQRASGQKLNMEKSAVKFCNATKPDRQRELGNLLGVGLIGVQDKYLGLPSTMQQSKKVTFQFIEDMISKKIASWKGTFLSPAGMEVLIKVVLSAMPVYTMGCFLIPKENINRFHKQMSDFWWGQRGEERKTHWVAWDKMCFPKEQGGLGFRHLGAFNQALLARQCWRILQQPDLLISQMYKAKYFNRTNILRAKLGSNPSWGWRSILHGRDLLVKGLCWQVGDGTSINAVIDKWLPTNPPRSPQILPHLNLISFFRRVCDFIKHGSWDVTALRQIFVEDDIPFILSIPLPVSSVSDRLIWPYANSGAYTVHSGYQLVVPFFLPKPVFRPVSPIDAQCWAHIWDLSITPKLKLFLWKIFRNVLPTRDFMRYKKMNVSEECPVCDQAPESVEHIFLQCPLVALLGRRLDLPLHLIVPDNMALT
ncbi:Putative ribonuclease H protein At1g65750 [Linum grandiflorum]